MNITHIKFGVEVMEFIDLLIPTTAHAQPRTLIQKVGMCSPTIWIIATIVKVEKDPDVPDCGYVQYVVLALVTLREAFRVISGTGSVGTFRIP